LLSVIPQGGTDGLLLFNTFIDEIGVEVIHFKFSLFSDDLEICRDMNSVECRKSLQTDLFGTTMMG
jgi:hypothetical protein